MKIAAAIVALCSICVAIVLAAAPPTPAPSSTGVVNVEKVMAECEKAKQADAQLKGMERKLEGQLKLMAQSRLLTEQEINELVTLSAKEKPTAAEQSRIAALQQLDKDRETKLKALQAEQNPTDQQKQELKDLQGSVIASGKLIEQTQKDYQKQINEVNAKLTVQIAKDVRAAVEAVAKESNTPMVLNKAAVIVGGNDLTEKVIKKLNAKA